MKVKEDIRVKKDRRSRSGRPTRYPGITRHAMALGVSRNHLWEVLRGARPSRSLMARYNSLVAKEGGAA